MINNTNLIIGTIIHIGKIFESHDGALLSNRYMCIIGIEDGNLLMLPMSAFHNNEHKIKKLSHDFNFEYSINQGNTKNGYIKCDQLYVLNIDEFNRFSNQIKIKRKMESQYFSKLTTHLDKLNKKNKLQIIRKDMIFQDLLSLKDNKKTIKAFENED